MVTTRAQAAAEASRTHSPLPLSVRAHGRWDLCIGIFGSLDLLMLYASLARHADIFNLVALAWLNVINVIFMATSELDRLLLYSSGAYFIADAIWVCP
jgi:uncharacterized membrane protein YobD (UPF0266 family)